MSTFNAYKKVLFKFCSPQHSWPPPSSPPEQTLLCSKCWGSWAPELHYYHHTRLPPQPHLFCEEHRCCSVQHWEICHSGSLWSSFLSRLSWQVLLICSLCHLSKSKCKIGFTVGLEMQEFYLKIVIMKMSYLEHFLCNSFHKMRFTLS